MSDRVEVVRATFAYTSDKAKDIMFGVGDEIEVRHIHACSTATARGIMLSASHHSLLPDLLSILPFDFPVLFDNRCSSGTTAAGGVGGIRLREKRACFPPTIRMQCECECE